MYLAKETVIKAKHVSLMMLISLILSLVSVRQAQAKDLVKVTIVGPGLKGAVELTDAESKNIFGKLWLANQIDKPPSADTEPYFEITVSLGTGTKIEATYPYYYYPASDEHPSYIYYPDVINGWSDVEGHYFLLSEDTDRALRDGLITLGASLSGTANPSIITFNPQLPWVWLIVGIVLCISIGIAVRLRRLNSAKTSH